MKTASCSESSSAEKEATTCTSISSGRLLRIAVPVLAALLQAYVAYADDLIVNGTNVTVASGTYDTVVVENSGVLTVNGTLTAQELYLITGGVLTVSSNLNAALASLNGTVTVSGNVVSDNFHVLFGTTTVRGHSNSTGNLVVWPNATMVACGDWYLDDVWISTNATLRVYSLSGSVPKSGTIFIHANCVRIQTNGVIDAVGVGNDDRGQGRDWYHSASAGSHGGRGGRGYWNSSGDGQSQIYGSAFTYDSFMGGAAGQANGLSYGGGSVTIEAEEFIKIDGYVLANGPNGPNNYFGGAAGGGILLRSPTIFLDGYLSANGGNGGYYGGGGGGGRIKVFYQSIYVNGILYEGQPDVYSNLLAHTSVSGGVRGGYLNTQAGGNGSVYYDNIPRASVFSPRHGATVTNGSITFSFVIEDLSALLDGRNDSLSPVIELSTDGFNTIAYTFDRDVSTSGWNKVLHYSGDTVVYVPQGLLASGVYQWRVRVRDGSLYSRPSQPISIGIEAIVPVQSVGIELVTVTAPRIIIRAGIGSECRIEYTESLGANTDWKHLADVTATENPFYHLDRTGIDKPQRFYKVTQLP